MVFGLRYVDHVLWAAGTVAAGRAVAGGRRGQPGQCARQRGLRLPVAAAIVLFGPAIFLNLIQPVIEQLYVKPDELRVEQPYLERNIALTRRPIISTASMCGSSTATATLTAASLEQDAPTINNIRLWDPRPLIATYRQLQEIRLYYDFQDVISTATGSMANTRR